MTREPTDVLEARRSHDSGLRVEFFRQGRRLAHRIRVFAAHEAYTVLQSIEGDDDDTFPPSPPLQQLAMEDRSDGHRVALLVGMAGRGHWSVCAEADSTECQIRFDIACRLQTDSFGHLGTAYEMPVAWHELHGSPTFFTELGGYRCYLEPQPANGQSRPVCIAIRDTQIVVSPSCDRSSANQRWCYRLVLRDLVGE